MRCSEWPRHAISHGVAPGRGWLRQLLCRIRRIGTTSQMLRFDYLADIVDAPIQLVKLGLGRHRRRAGRGA